METIEVIEVCPTKTQAWIKKGAILVDVRERNEVNDLSFDTPSMINIPISEFEVRYTELPFDRDIVIACQNGTRSLRAAGYLIYNGYDPLKVVNMKHGMIRWVQRGFPTKGDTSGINLEGGHAGCCSGKQHQHKESGEGCCNH